MRIRTAIDRLHTILSGPVCAECGVRERGWRNHETAHFLWAVEQVALQSNRGDSRLRRDTKDPARITRILRKLETAWLAAPELRLGQLVSVITRDDWPRDDKFYMPDGVLESSLDATLRAPAEVS